MSGKLLKRTILLLSSFAMIEMSPVPIVQDASAQNLLQALFGGQAARKKREEERRRKEAAARVKKKPPRISAPKYYTYKADKLVTVKTSLLVDPVTTSAVNYATASENAEPTDQDIFALGLQNFSDSKLKALPEVADALIKHYQQRPRFNWVDENGANEKAQALIEVLAQSDMFGLPSENYAVTLPELNSQDNVETTNWQELMRFELQLSAAALSYILDANRGMIDPNRVSGYHDFERKQTNLEGVLLRLSFSRNPKAILESFNPSGEHFKALKSELAELLSADEKERITIADGTFLKPGRSSPEMRNIVASIRLKGSEALKSEYAFELNTYRGDDLYTPELVTLVKAFQKENDLAADGIVGKKTIRAMVEDSNALKVEKLQFAMERARWLPHKFANKHVFINQPAYKVTYFEDSEPHLSMRVVVGKKSNQTNFFSDEIEKVEFNPSWGVPQSIITNEMLPKLRADPSYLDRLGYKVSYKGRSTSSSSVNWNALSSTRAIGVRQPPGPKNALGELKILFPNAHAIYMHDTPAKKLFGRDTRAYSHGCVRLQHPREMAAAVLGSNMDEIAAHISPRKNKTVFLENPIPVHVAYFTAWPNAETGEVEYFADVYGRDKALQKAFATTVKSRASVGS